MSIFDTFNIEVEDHDIEAINQLHSRTSLKPVIIHQKNNRLKDLNERYEELEMAGCVQDIHEACVSW